MNMYPVMLLPVICVWFICSDAIVYCIICCGVFVIVLGWLIDPSFPCVVVYLLLIFQYGYLLPMLYCVSVL